MNSIDPTERPPGQARPPHRHCGTGNAALLAAVALTTLALAGASTAARAADPIDGLGAAFRPPAAVATPVPLNTAPRTDADGSGLRVVVTSPTRSVASIDGKIVRVGDTVNGRRVTRIDAQGVVLRGEAGATERLLLEPAVVKRASPAGTAQATDGASR